MDHGLAAVLSGFRVLKAKEDTVKDPAAFLAACLRNAKKRSMTPEQREGEISEMRSAIGKIGAAKAHAKEISYLKDEFAKVISEDAD